MMRRADTAKHGRSDGIYPYDTAGGIRWRFVYRRSDGTQTTKRGFSSQRAARDARRRLVEQVERGEVRHTKETFGDYWARWLTHRRPYLEPGTWSGYEIHGRKRLVPAVGSLSLGDVGVDAIRAFASELSEATEAGELAIKTANNALGTLAICLNDAVKDGLIVGNPALLVGRLPPAHVERDYLRLEEIPRRRSTSNVQFVRFTFSSSASTSAVTVRRRQGRFSRFCARFPDGGDHLDTPADASKAGQNNPSGTGLPGRSAPPYEPEPVAAGAPCPPARSAKPTADPS
jgi:Phage integrase, N-terminal SAM-like domain